MIFFVITVIPKHKTTNVYNSEIIKRRSSTSMSSFFAMNDFYIINPASMCFLLDQIYVKRPCSSYITLFLKNIYFPACFLLNNTKKISKLLFQLKENEILIGVILIAKVNWKRKRYSLQCHFFK